MHCHHYPDGYFFFQWWAMGLINFLKGLRSLCARCSVRVCFFFVLFLVFFVCLREFSLSLSLSLSSLFPLSLPLFHSLSFALDLCFVPFLMGTSLFFLNFFPSVCLSHFVSFPFFSFLFLSFFSFLLNPLTLDRRLKVYGIFLCMYSWRIWRHCIQIMVL